MDFDAEATELGFGFGGEIRGIRSQHARAAIEQHHAALGGIDVPEIVTHVELRNVADGAGEFDASRPAADDDEIERRMPALLQHLPLGQLEGQQHATANFGGIFDGLEARRERLPLIVTEVGVRGAGSEHEVVVVEACAAGQRHVPRVDVDADYLIHQHLGIALMAQDGADGLGNVGGRQHRQRHLIEQGLEEVMIAAVDQGYIDGQVRQPGGGVQAGKASADDDHAGPAARLLLVLGRFGEFTQWGTSIEKMLEGPHASQGFRGKDRENLKSCDSIQL